jgi:hypothetical protein
MSETKIGSPEPSGDKAQKNPLNASEIFEQNLCRVDKFPDSSQPSAHEMFLRSACSVVGFPKHNPAVFPWNINNSNKEMNIGSGVIVKTDIPNSCEVVTGYHVSHEPEAYFNFPDGQQYKATLDLVDMPNALSFYSVEGVPEKTCRALPISESEPSENEPVVALGAAGQEFASAKNPKWDTGQISVEITREEFYRGRPKLRGSDMKADRITEASMNTSMIVGKGATLFSFVHPGFSGGPWVGPKGLVGIAFGSDGRIGVAEKAKWVLEDLKRINFYYYDNGMAPRKPIIVEGE